MLIWLSKLYANSEWRPKLGTAHKYGGDKREVKTQRFLESSQTTGDQPRLTDNGTLAELETPCLSDNCHWCG